MKEVVKNDVLKLLDVWIVYYISNSKWVSLTQVVPKKSEITVVKNEKGEPIPTQIPSNWCMCTDYRKLNDATRKYHFPLSLTKFSKEWLDIPTTAFLIATLTIIKSL